MEGILPPPNQDEDVETDEDLLIRNIKDCVQDLKKSIQEFLANSKNKQRRKSMVYNYENKVIMKGKAGDFDALK